MHDTAPRTALVADRRPLERDLLRFLLEDEGFAVRAEAGSMADLLLAIQRDAPDAVVLHEDVAAESDDAAVQQIRALVPDAIVVVVTADAETLRPVFGDIADRVVIDGVGLAALGLAVSRPGGAPVSALAPLAVGSAAAGERSRQRRGRWVGRVQGAVAAGVVALAVVALQNVARQPAPTIVADDQVASPSLDDPLAPDRAVDDRGGSVSGSLVSLTSMLAIAPGSNEGDAAGIPTEESNGSPPPDEPGPTGATGAPPPPETSGTVARPGNAQGPPPDVFGRLKPSVQQVLSKLRPSNGGAPPGHAPTDGTTATDPWIPPGQAGPRGGGSSDGGGPGRGKDHGAHGHGPPPWAVSSQR